MRGLSSALLHLQGFLEDSHPGFADDKRLAEQARALSVLYTEAEHHGAAIPPDAASSVAYLAHFGPRAVAAVSRAAAAWPVVPRHVLDVGAGCGASALALLSLGVSRVTLLERDAVALRLAERLLKPFSDRVARIVHDVGHANPTDADAVCSAFSFGEIEAEPREAFAQLERVAPRASAWVLVDAGDRPRARRLQQLRDVLVSEGRPIAGPCAHQDPCPALVRDRDWCHDRIEKQLPPLLARFADRVGRDSAHMSLSWLAVAEHKQHDAVVVIGEAKKEKGRVRLPVCGPGGVRFVQALKRHREAHDALLSVERGARLPLGLVERARQTDTAHIEDPAELSSPS